jgi:undecaprenyl pyrophosphate phosphatase UppP
MASRQSPGVLPQATRVLILAVVVGTIFLMVFKLIFPHVDVTQVLTVTGLMSLLIAVGLHVAWMRFLKRRKHT